MTILRSLDGIPPALSEDTIAPGAVAARNKTVAPDQRSSLQNPSRHATHYRTVDIDGVSVFYREAGAPDSPVALLLPGWPSSSSMFRDLILELSTTHHVIAPDYPGFGNSSVPARSQGPYTFDALADTVGKFIDKVGIGRFALYATDFGGLVGYRLMLNVPHRMTALIAQNNPLFLAESPWFSALFPYWNEETEENRSKVKAHYLTLDVIRDLYLTGVRDETLIDPTLWQVDYQSLQRTGAADISLDLLLDIRSNGPILERAQDYLRTHQPPTLVVSGKNDILFTEQNQQRYREILPDVEMHLTDSGHCALVDKSKEISQTVHEFLVRRL